jgi:hypothetical protein
MHSWSLNETVVLIAGARGIGVATARGFDTGLPAHASSAPAADQRTYPVERAVMDIVSGFEQRRPRICTPRFVYAAHALRPLLTTRIFQRDVLAVAPEMERAFQQELAERGVEGASVSERVASQVGNSAERVQA